LVNGERKCCLNRKIKNSYTQFVDSVRINAIFCIGNRQNIRNIDIWHVGIVDNFF
jgi:hypothetical protein